MTLSRRHVAEYRRWLRKIAGAASCRRIDIIDGVAGPTLTGDTWHYETLGGTRIRHPSAYRKVGRSNMRYVSSTISVEVGRDWLTQHNIPVEALS